MKLVFSLMVFALLFSASVSRAQSSANYAIAYDVFDNGGSRPNNSSGVMHRAHSIIGQSAALHSSTAVNHNVSSGAICMFCHDVTVGVESVIIPMIMRLYQNYPNPFNPGTTIRYSLERGGTVQLVLYNLLGEQVDVLVEEYQDPGDYSIDYIADHLQSGVYLYRLSTEHGQLTRRMVLMK